MCTLHSMHKENDERKEQSSRSCWRFWDFHIADACYNFYDKILDLSEKKAEEKMSSVWHIDYPCLKPCMWRYCGPYKQCIYTVSLAQKSPKDSYLFIRTCWSALVWLSMSSSCRSECLGRDGLDAQGMCLGWVKEKPWQHWCMCVACIHAVRDTSLEDGFHFLQKLSIKGNLPSL